MDRAPDAGRDTADFATLAVAHTHLHPAHVAIGDVHTHTSVAIRSLVAAGDDVTPHVPRGRSSDLARRALTHIYPRIQGTHSTSDPLFADG